MAALRTLTFRILRFLEYAAGLLRAKGRGGGPPAGDLRAGIRLPPSLAAPGDRRSCRAKKASFGLTLSTAVCLLPSAAPAQSSAQYAALAPSVDGREPPLACGTPALFAGQLMSGFAPRGAIPATPAPAPDGRPLWYDQNPRLLHAEHIGGLALDDFLVLGDVETILLERWSSGAGRVLEETWRRVRTTAVDGRLISVFNPRWNDAELRDTVGANMRGFDLPYVYFGSVTVPSPDRADDETFQILLSWAPRNVPPAQVARIDADTQYASHVVNLVIPGFGDGRLSAGDYGYDLADAAERFYRHFEDEYDSIAFVSRQLQLMPYGAFHRNLRNPVAGLGLPVFDNSDSYGSAGVLRSVEFYPSAKFAVTSLSNHQIAHQWVYYWDWSSVSGGVERAGHQPETHTPLLYPGEAYSGAVLRVTRRVAAVDGGHALRRRAHAESGPVPPDDPLSHGADRPGGNARAARLRAAGAVRRRERGHADGRNLRRGRRPSRARQRSHGGARRTHRTGRPDLVASDGRGVARRIAVRRRDELVEPLRRPPRGRRRGYLVARDALVLRGNRRPGRAADRRDAREPRQDRRRLRGLPPSDRPSRVPGRAARRAGAGRRRNLASLRFTNGLRIILSEAITEYACSVFPVSQQLTFVARVDRPLS